jgi:hypothetical protein
MKLDRKRVEFSASIVIGILVAAVLGSLWRSRGLVLIVETLVAAITGGLIAYLLYPRFFPADRR